MLEASAFIQIIVFLVGVAAAAIWLKSTLVKQRHEELETLAETRGQRIEDMKNQLDRQGKEIEELRAQIKTIRELLTSNIASQVADKVIEHLNSAK